MNIIYFIFVYICFLIYIYLYGVFFGNKILNVLSVIVSVKYIYYQDSVIFFVYICYIIVCLFFRI